MHNNNITRHHTLWERRNYVKTTLPNRLREHPGMVIPLPRLDHDQLHIEIAPLPVMSTNLARLALSHLEGSHNWRQSQRPRLEMFEGLTEKLFATSHMMGRIGLEAGMFAEQFEEQRTHMDRAYLL